MYGGTCDHQMGTPLVGRQTDTTENIPFQQTIHAGGNKTCSADKPIRVPIRQHGILSGVGWSSITHHLIQVVHNVVYNTIRVNKPVDVLEYLGPEEKK